jgi:hypothetical protein
MAERKKESGSGPRRRLTALDSGNYALVSAWRGEAAIPTPLRDAFWTAGGRGVCVVCREEKSAFAGPITVVYTPEFEPHPAFIPALACEPCFERALPGEIPGRTRAIAGEVTGVEIHDSGSWRRSPILAMGPPAKAAAPRRPWWRFWRQKEAGPSP